MIIRNFKVVLIPLLLLLTYSYICQANDVKETKDTTKNLYSGIRETSCNDLRIKEKYYAKKISARVDILRMTEEAFSQGKRFNVIAEILETAQKQVQMDHEVLKAIKSSKKSLGCLW